MWMRTAPIDPFLDVTAVRQIHTENYDVWGITVTSRGGETIDEIRVEIVSGPLHFVGPSSFEGLKAGWSTGIRVQVDDPVTSKGAVRVVQSGRVERTYDLVLEDKR